MHGVHTAAISALFAAAMLAILPIVPRKIKKLDYVVAVTTSAIFYAVLAVALTANMFFKSHYVK